MDRVEGGKGMDRREERGGREEGREELRGGGGRRNWTWCWGNCTLPPSVGCLV